MRAPLMALSLALSGCFIFCPDCGCYPDIWYAEWQQPELADWVREHGDAFGAQEQWLPQGLGFDATAAGLPDGSVLQSVVYRFHEGGDGPRLIELAWWRDGPVLEYTYAGSHGNEFDGPRHDRLAAALTTFIERMWLGSQDAGEALEARLLAEWVAVDHYEWAGGRIDVPDTWAYDALWAAGLEEMDRGVDSITFGEDGFEMVFRVPSWAFELDHGVWVGALGGVQAGSYDNRTLDVAAIQDGIRSEFARRGLPAPTFDAFAAHSHDICVD